MKGFASTLEDTKPFLVTIAKIILCNIVPCLGSLAVMFHSLAVALFYVIAVEIIVAQGIMRQSITVYSASSAVNGVILRNIMPEVLFYHLMNLCERTAPADLTTTM